MGTVALSLPLVALALSMGSAQSLLQEHSSALNPWTLTAPLFLQQTPAPQFPFPTVLLLCSPWRWEGFE